jgi:transposase
VVFVAASVVDPPDLVAARTQTINRLHRLLMDLVPGGPDATSPASAPPLSSTRLLRPVLRQSPAGSRPHRHAPLEASSGQVIRHWLSRAGDRRLNHALYMMAMVQVRRPSAGQAYYQRKLAEGKSPKEALRCLKRRLSDAVYRCLRADQEHHTLAVTIP